MNERIFNPAKRQRLNNPERLEWIQPEKLWNFINCSHPKVVVDIGAGTGYITQALAKFHPSAVFLALDIEPLMIDEMNQSFAPNTNIIPKLMEPNKIPLQDNFADLIININVYHEFDDEVKNLKEIYRVLQPEGKVLIIDWEKKHESCERGPAYDHRISMETVMKDLASANFMDIRSTADLKFHYALCATKHI